MNTNSKIYSKIIGTGSYLPRKIIKNDELPKNLDTSDEWIVSRTGIKQRHIAETNELTSDLGTKALEEALKNANLNPNDLDAIIVATTTPDLFMPATATKIQNNIGMTKGFAFDIQAVCSGFIYALNVAHNFIISGQVKNIAIIGADCMSKIVDWSDRSTCVLFGDGAGAVILQSKKIDEEKNKNSEKEIGIIDFILSSNGELLDILKTPEGIGSGIQELEKSKLKMNGKEVFKYAVTQMVKLSQEILEKHNYTVSDLALFVPHQANARIMSYISETMEIPSSKIAFTVDKHANTSAASIPTALHEYITQDKIKDGNLILLAAAGAGMTSGSALIRF